MGCANSKEGQNYLGEGGLNRPLARSMSMPVHHPAQKKGDSYHVVALTSSTYGILKMDPVKESGDEESENVTKKGENGYGLYNFRRSLDRSSEMAAKTWSEVNNLLHNYVPFKSNHSKTPSLEEPETINTWELMEGLEDSGSSPLASMNGHAKGKSVDRILDRSFSFHTVKDVEQLAKDEPRVSVWHRVTPGVKLADENSKSSSKILPVEKLKYNYETGSRCGSGFVRTSEGLANSFLTTRDSIADMKTPSRIPMEKQKKTHRKENGCGLEDVRSEGLADTFLSSGDSMADLKSFSRILTVEKHKKNNEMGSGLGIDRSEDLADSLSSPSEDSTARPLWMQEQDDEESPPTLFDADLISTFRKALDEISPRDPMEPFSETPKPSPSQGTIKNNKEDEKGTFRQRSSSFQARLSSFQQRIDEGSNRKIVKISPVKPANQREKAPPGGEDSVVLYFTSLRGIRKTFEECCTVKMILQGFRVWVDERDISMHALFRQELQDLLGKPVTVPSLFIRGKYIGGVDEIQQLHEVGELAEYLEGFPVHSCLEPCDACGDVRFVPCPICDGSRKVFREEDLMVIRCLQCNENGLIRCSLCCS